jgi:long-chain acyl-CoA synthetase
VPYDIEPPTDSLYSLLEAAVREAPNDVATQFFGATMTYAEIGEQVERVAAGLKRLGVKAGDRVALVLPNCPQHIVAFYAVLRLRAVVVEHNPLYTARELRHMFEDHAARIAICWDAAVEKLQEQPSDIKLEKIISVNLLDAMPSNLRFALGVPIPKLRKLRAKLTRPAHGAFPWGKLLENAPIEEWEPKPKVDDLAVIIYTSGTTSLPKGAMLTHRSLYSNALQGEAWMLGAQQRKEVFYAILPFFHAFGLTLFLTFGVMKQARLVLFPTFDAQMTISVAKKNPPSVVAAVPPIFEKLAEVSKEKHVSLENAKYCISGAMSLPLATIEAWEEVAGGLLIEGYGMTEASPIIAGNPMYPTRRAGTIGVPFPSTYVRVVDPENPDQDVEQGEVGELLAKGPQIFCGYWNNSAATEATLLPGGWLRTGDLVRQDADGFLTIVDRVKEVIITGGFNVSPSEVEAVLRSHPDVIDAAVVGLPAHSGGEKVAAAVVMREGVELDEAEMRHFSRERLAAYKVPRTITALPSFPMSMLGKVLRKEVRAELLAKKTEEKQQ